MFTPSPTERSQAIAARVERFVRDIVAPYERDPRCEAHGPSAELVAPLPGGRCTAQQVARNLRIDVAQCIAISRSKN